MVVWNGLKLKFHRCIGQLRPSTSASSEDGLATYLVHMCRGRMIDVYVHAKRNGRAVPLNSRRRKNGEASHIVVNQK